MTRTQTALRLAKIKLRLNARRAKCGSEDEPVLVRGLPGETPSDTVARRLAENGKSPMVVVPHIPSAEEWERQASAYQAWIIRRVLRVDDPNFRPPSAEEIEAACRCAMRGEPIAE